MVRLSDVLAITILGFGCARVTRIVTADTVTAPLRARIVRRYGTGWQTQLVHCPWCVGWWVAATMTILAGIVGILSGFWVTILSVPAVAQLAAWVREISDKE